MAEVIAGLVVAWLIYMAVRAALFVRRSRRLRDQYRLAHHDQKRELEAAWQDDPELASHMRPLTPGEIWKALASAAAVLALLVVATLLRTAYF
jgi:hypothetical protein